MASLLKNISHWWKGPPKQTNPSIDADPARCLNCEIDLSPSDKYCPNCGQRNRQKKLNLADLLFETAVNFLGYDSKLWFTLKRIWIPGRVATLFQSGKRVSLVHPTRLFFFSFLVLVFSSQETIRNFDVFSSRGSPVSISIDSDSSTTAKLSIDSLDLDSIRLAKLIPDSAAVSELINDSLVVSDVLGVADSISLRIFHRLDSIERVRISEDYVEETHQDTIYKEFGLENTWKYKIARQQIKFFKDRGAFNRFLISSIVWMLLLLQPFIAFFLKITLYRWYYSDHLVWSVYLFSTIFLFLIILQWSRNIIGWADLQNLESALTDITFIIIAIYSFLSLKMFYNKGFIKSFFIFFYLSTATAFTLGFFLVIDLALSFVLF